MCKEIVKQLEFYSEDFNYFTPLYFFNHQQTLMTHFYVTQIQKSRALQTTCVH